MAEKPVRAVRTPKGAPAPKRESLADRGSRLHRSWGSVIEGVLEVDVEAAHEELRQGLVLKRPYTASKVLEYLDEVQEKIRLAERLSAKARRDYELFKEAHQAWLEVKKSAARIALEAEKKDNKLKKTITNDMILDQVRATWEGEYVERVQRLKDFQAAVHYMERLAADWRGRPSTLSDMTKLVQALGAREGAGRR